MPSGPPLLAPPPNPYSSNEAAVPLAMVAEPAPERPSTLRIALVVGLASALVAAVITSLLFVALGDEPSSSTATALPGSNITLSGEQLDIQALLAKVGPSVVTIETGRSTSSGVFNGAGSGVIIDDTGLILTNAHVIASADSISVTYYDGAEHEATLVGSFPSEDIALIQSVGVTGAAPAELGNSDSLRVGDDLVAIGNALNLGGSPTVTVGIVSATNRSISAPGIALSGLIQTDAAINPGNSGGPLLNAAGQVVGINTAIIDDAQNIGFALAIDKVKPLVDEIRDGNGDLTPDTAFLGVETATLDTITSVVREQFEISVDDGAFVQLVVPDSAAESAGIERGDVIVSVDGEAVESTEDVQRLIRSREPGDVITIEVERGGRLVTREATLGSLG